MHVTISLFPSFIFLSLNNSVNNNECDTFFSVCGSLIYNIVVYTIHNEWVETFYCVQSIVYVEWEFSMDKIEVTS